jgi:colanic acid/amylovoran biosynthesis glycosyltransferase
MYVINYFPNFIETMIYREVEAVRGRGYRVYTFSIRRPPDALIPADARTLAEATRYILPVSPLRLLVRHLRAIRRHGRAYWGALWHVLSGTHADVGDRLRSVCHFAEAVSVLPEVEELGIDHIHAHWAVGATTVALVVSRLLDIPFTFTAHAYDIWREQLLLPEKLHAASQTVTCTGCNRDHLIHTYGADPAKIRVVYHGVDLQRFRPQPRQVNGEPVVLSVGRLVEQKGYEYLLHACADLASDGERFQCRIVGDGPRRAGLEALADRLGLSDRVHFLGKMFHEQLVAEYAAADVFALLCVPASDDDRDGIPNTLIEAMAMELPVVSTRFSGIPELVTDGATGFLTETADHRGAASALRTLLRDPALRMRMGIAGRTRVAAAFTVDAATAALDEMFRAATMPTRNPAPRNAVAQLVSARP